MLHISFFVVRRDVIPSFRRVKVQRPKPWRVLSSRGRLSFMCALESTVHESHDRHDKCPWVIDS